MTLTKKMTIMKNGGTKFTSGAHDVGLIAITSPQKKTFVPKSYEI